ncbi:UNVERIFIED_CONTAM: hypothetical protein Sangu_3212600 [Sesamum angustifolium]|uniref:Reverse transcriptase domain-containing protein n=1 Tax=Sesamum angustifolium TaxID=2727405 RepID=A0AAW2JK48_9LAMI
MTLLANYEVGRIFIDSRSSVDMLFDEAYYEMQLGDTLQQRVNTSLYGFAGEVVHPRGMISLPLTLGTRTLRKTFMFLVVDVPSAYNVILGRLTLNAFQVVISTYDLKIKFLTFGGVGEVQGDPSNHESVMLKPYVKDKKKYRGDPPASSLQKMEKRNTTRREIPRKGRDVPEGPTSRRIVEYRTFTWDLEKITGIDSQMEDKIRKKVIQCLQHNIDIFRWTPQDLEGIDLSVITHHLNINPDAKPIK